MTTITHMTAEDLLRMADSDMQHELVKGELRILPPAKKEHGLIESAILQSLFGYLKTNPIGIVTTGDTGYILSRNPDTVRAPDVGFISNERAARDTDTKQYWTIAPDLAVEIVSPSDVLYEVEEKIQDFLDAGTLIVWLVNPRRHTVTIYEKDQNPVVLREKQNLAAPGILSGFQLPIIDIFPQ